MQHLKQELVDAVWSAADAEAYVRSPKAQQGHGEGRHCTRGVVNWMRETSPVTVVQPASALNGGTVLRACIASQQDTLPQISILFGERQQTARSQRCSCAARPET